MRRLPCLVLLVLLAGAATAEPWVAPRGPGGKPDLNGTWQAFSRANDGLEAHAARAAYALREGPHGPLPAKEVLAFGAVGAVPAGLGVVVGGKIPYQEWARAKQQENQAAWLERDPEIKCYQPGIPRATYLPYPFQIFHNERALFFAYEYAGAVRNVLLEDPGPAPLDSWMGQSVGRWEGDTLVVDTVAITDKSFIDSSSPHSDQMTVHERIRFIEPGILQDEITVRDPIALEEPWQITRTYRRADYPNDELREFACAEGLRDRPH